MKTTLLFPLLLAGLALAGCNSATRSDTATETNTFVTPAPEPVINPTATPDGSATSSPSTSDATYNNSLQSSSATTSANNVDTTESSVSTTPASSEPFATGTLPSSTYSSIDASRTTPTSTPDVSSTAEVPQPTVDVAASATQTPPAPSPDTSLTAESDRIPATVTPSDLPKTSSDSTFAEPVASSALSGDISGRLTEWKLNAADIQADLDRGATITRSKNDIVGAPTGASDDDVVETMVKGKLQADMHTSTAKIDVDAANGEVTLKGTAASADAIGRAIALSLDTQGVARVSSDLKLANGETSSAEANAATPPPQN